MDVEQKHKQSAQGIIRRPSISLSYEAQHLRNTQLESRDRAFTLLIRGKGPRKRFAVVPEQNWSAEAASERNR